jgi:hypothetical protein
VTSGRQHRLCLPAVYRHTLGLFRPVQAGYNTAVGLLVSIRDSISDSIAAWLHSSAVVASSDGLCALHNLLLVTGGGLYGISFLDMILHEIRPSMPWALQ